MTSEDKFKQFEQYLLSEYVTHYSDNKDIKSYKQLASMLEYQIYAKRLGFSSEEFRRFLQKQRG